MLSVLITCVLKYVHVYILLCAANNIAILDS